MTKREMLLLAALWLVVQVLRSVCCMSWDLCTSVTSGRDVAQTGTHTRARSFSFSLCLLMDKLLDSIPLVKGHNNYLTRLLCQTWGKMRRQRPTSP